MKKSLYETIYPIRSLPGYALKSKSSEPSVKPFPKSGRSSICSKDPAANGCFRGVQLPKFANLERSRSLVDESLLIKTPLAMTQLMVSAIDSDTVNYEDP